MTNPREYAREDAEREFIFKIAAAHWDGEEKLHEVRDEGGCDLCDEPETDVYDLTNDDAHEWIVATIQAARSIQVMAVEEEVSDHDFNDGDLLRCARCGMDDNAAEFVGCAGKAVL